ncbi:eukaryotic translation initiation factor 3 [Lophiostoma macrostomum CBS 122681]|uniref:Eukaryotic translation initiation factor 3 subunit L n=1 Tax=Lophiostoma macrostomum CBS 122681 TaxID=1314788 RepID=A0A6A6T7C3_9PLEO|nr:eukaryotic translation initiation factor 3 [Lophiostoma macrostomum CBS 122681]
MSLRERIPPYQHGEAPIRAPEDESDVEEEALVNDYREQVQYDGMEDLDRIPSNMGSGDIQAQLQAAATPLEFQATLETKFASYDNYCNLFHYILNSEGPVDLEVPNYFWAWDVIDEFIYQFNSFCSYRQRVAQKSENGEEIQLLRENPNTWGCYSVLNVLYSLIQRSQISEQLAAMKRNEDPAQYAGEYGSRPLYKMLGYFSIIGLLRVHCLLGDFSLALKTLDDIELNKKAMFARVMAAHFTTYYYVGFSYMMMRRYSDAIRMFSHILVYVSRTKNFQKNAQYDSITKKNDQMYALIAICVAFQPTRLDDTIHTALREKYGEQFNRLQRGGPESLPLFEELFRSACPKFISPTPPDFDNPEINIDPVEHHLRIFMDEVKINMMSPTVKSYLKLYTTMDLKKLAGFLEVEPEKLRCWLLVNKQRNRQTRWSEGGLLEGDTVHSSDLDYALEGVCSLYSNA